jgi:hypothetical protein
VASVGLIPISLKVHDPEVHHDDAGHRPLHRHANPIRGVPGGGLPWIITAGNGALKSDGRLLVHVRVQVPCEELHEPVIKHERQGRGGRSGPHAGLW